MSPQCAPLCHSPSTLIGASLCGRRPSAGFVSKRITSGLIVIQEQSQKVDSVGAEHLPTLHARRSASVAVSPHELLSENNSLNICVHGRNKISAKHVPTSCHCLRGICECGRTRPSVRRHGMAELRKRSGWNAILATLADQPRECVNAEGRVDISYRR